MATISHTYYSVPDFISALNGPCENPKNEPSKKVWFDTEERQDWHGVGRDARAGESSPQCMLRLLDEGWCRGVELMSKVESSLDIPFAKTIRRRLKWSDAGDEVNIQRIYSGNIDRAWTTTTKQPVRGPTRVRIVCDSTASGGLDVETMRWRGVAALKLTDLLTSAGYSVQTESAFKGARDGDAFKLRVVVKGYSEPLDLHTLAATTALPAFFRSLGHGWGIVAARLEMPYPSYSVDQLTESDVADERDNAPVFVAHQMIKDAASATAWIASVVSSLQPDDNAEVA